MTTTFPDGNRAFLKEAARLRRQSLASFLTLAARIILEAAADLEHALGFPVGQGKLVSVLFGSDSSFVQAHELSSLPHYGVFRNVRRVWIERLVLALRDSGYLCSTESIRPVLELSEEAHAVVSNSEETPLLPGHILGDAVLGPACPLTALEEKLRILRSRIALRLGRRGRQILTDLEMREFGRRPPASLEETLSRLPGELKEYADAIWSMCRVESEKTEP